ncbi:MAG: HPr family phosphocarrier protein [Bacillota bacterium]|nr:HPr family phosphocarrier protein [Bacillota bacterium]
MISVKYQIKNDEGLHARPATDFCQTAMKFKSAISILKDGEAYEAKSILMVLCVGAEKGDEIEIQADGEDEKEAIEALIKVLENDNADVI